MFNYTIPVITHHRECTRFKPLDSGETGATHPVPDPGQNPTPTEWELNGPERGRPTRDTVRLHRCRKLVRNTRSQIRPTLCIHRSSSFHPVPDYHSGTFKNCILEIFTYLYLFFVLFCFRGGPGKGIYGKERIRCNLTRGQRT